MTRASISLTPPNDDWIQQQIDNQEFSSRSEVVNDLIRKARAQTRERDFILARLISSEESVKREGWVDRSPEDMLRTFKDKARKHGKI